MLKNIPPILSPELLKVLCEMGHGDRICIGDGNFPGASMAKPNNCVLVRADGHGVPELLDAILQVIPLDEYVEHPALIMQVADKDKGLEVPSGTPTSRSLPSTTAAAPRPSAAWNVLRSMRKHGTPIVFCKAVKRRSTPTSSSRKAL